MTEWPLIIAALVFLAAYAIPVLGPDLPAWVLGMCWWLSWITWGIFVVDIVVRLALADGRLRYLTRHWYDVLVVALPLLRPLRLLRLIPLLSVLNLRARIRLRGRVAIYVAGGASLLAFCAALAVLDAERSSPNANITDFGDATWWVVTTMATVGYGDRYPVTGIGRMVGFGLMVGGIALLSTVTATLASWFVESVQAEKEQGDDLQARMRRLEAKVELLATGPKRDFGSSAVPSGLPADGHRRLARNRRWLRRGRDRTRDISDRWRRRRIRRAGSRCGSLSPGSERASSC